MSIVTGSAEVDSLREVMELFLSERLEGKLEKLSADDLKVAALKEQFQFDTWISEAARRVSQIQLVTHSLKAVHPDAKGSSFYAPPGNSSRDKLVGTHCLLNSFHGDVVGNAAALDVYKFLRLELQGKTLLERILVKDEALIAALSSDREQALKWITAFSSITESRGVESSHTNAKQVYFLVGQNPCENDNYHLLAPLFASSLAHEVYLRINEDRFGDKAKAARQARRENQWWQHGYNQYPELAVQKLGGTKPQNVSQLNSERRGNNYLLASLPPAWTSAAVKPPWHTDSIFVLFGFRPKVYRLVRTLAEFLRSDPSNTMSTRDYRDELFSDLCAELLQFAAEIHTLPGGWSEDPKCRLNEAEKLWLDPGRAEADIPFHTQLKTTPWQSEIRRRFANWLNGRLTKAVGFVFGDVDHKYWSRQLAHDNEWRRNLDVGGRWTDTLEELEQELEL